MDLGESAGGIFAATTHLGARFPCYFHSLFTSHTRQNSQCEVLCSRKNLYSSKNQKRKKVLGKKKKKKKSSRLASIFRTRRSSSNQNLTYIMLKTRSPFIYASTSLDTNRNFERCLSIRCLTPQHIFLFFHFSLWRLCPLLRRPPQSSTERSSLQWVSFPGKS